MPNPGAALNMTLTLPTTAGSGASPAPDSLHRSLTRVDGHTADRWIAGDLAALRGRCAVRATGRPHDGLQICKQPQSVSWNVATERQSVLKLRLLQRCEGPA